MVNKVTLLGRIGSKNELRDASTTTKVLNFTMATSEYFKDAKGERQERTEWHKVVMFGPMAENFDKLVQKGNLVYVEGKIQTKEWTDKEGKKNYSTEINAYSFTLIPGQKKDDATAAAGTTTASTSATAAATSKAQEPVASSVDEDLPF